MSNKLPSREECLELLKENVSENVVEHSLLVNKIAMFLGGKLKENGVGVDLELLDRSSLLHDVDKLESLEKGRHGVLGEEKLKEKGWHSVGVVVRKHVLDQILVGLNAWEEKIVFYADKRVKHSEIVSLKERLGYIKERYCCVNKEMCERFEEIQEKCFALEKEVLGRASISKKLDGIEDV